jgi:putative restriction endonuclease
MPKAPPVKWTREHYLIALNVYRKLQFGEFDKGNPLIKQVAAKMGRSPGSLAMKLSNLASLDPVQRARGIRGLSRTGDMDREMWEEYNGHLNVLGPESEQLFHDLFTKDQDVEVDLLERDRVRLERPRFALPPIGPTMKEQLVKVRRGQQFFRQTVLNAYGVRCCITGINVPRLLVASHIKPWCDFPEERLNPRNGLCLSTLHDAAFDAGLISIDEGHRVILSAKLKSYLPEEALEKNFSAYEGKEITMPEQIAQPAAEFLAFHRKELFCE